MISILKLLLITKKEYIKDQYVVFADHYIGRNTTRKRKDWKKMHKID